MRLKLLPKYPSYMGWHEMKTVCFKSAPLHIPCRPRMYINPEGIPVALLSPKEGNWIVLGSLSALKIRFDAMASGDSNVRKALEGITGSLLLRTARRTNLQQRGSRAVPTRILMTMQIETGRMRRKLTETVATSPISLGMVLSVFVMYCAHARACVRVILIRAQNARPFKLPNPLNVAVGIS